MPGHIISLCPPLHACSFDVEAASGPFRLDLGDILYAPNTLNDHAKVRGTQHPGGVPMQLGLNITYA